MSKESIVDFTKPNAGRMYDYYLGGNHNFEVDRQAAEQVLKALPFAGSYARLQRWALQDIAVELSERRGYNVIIDFASGLPTNDNIHSKVPQGTTVIYSDYDPVVVEYAHEILGDTPDVYFFEADARRPQELLERAEVQAILGGRRKVAFSYWGISIFLEDDVISSVARYLYDWAAPGSCWAFNAQGADVPQTPAVQQIMQIYDQMGTKVYFRSLDLFHELLQPWTFSENGFVSLLDWHGFEHTEIAQGGAETVGPMGGGFGAYLVK
jgi:hypothetical protein